MDSRRSVMDLLSVGFGASVLMWAVGFFCRIPLGEMGEEAAVAPPTTELAAAGPVPAPWLFAILLVCMLGCGLAAGRWTRRGWMGGIWAGTVCAALNLLIVLGAVGGEAPNSLAPSAALFLPGSVLAGALLGAAGAAMGSRLRAAAWRPGQTAACAEPDWPQVFTLVAAAATFLLILVGGLVTSFRAGLHVPDWPNSFGYLMFFYPLSKMSGGIYFEHSHRLLGTLVGLTTLVLAIHALRTEDRRWVRRLALAALALVVLQGVLGGLRVTGRLTLSAARTDMAPSIALAVAHGVVGQVFFCVLAAWSAFRSRAWRQPPVVPAPNRGTDWKFQAGLVVLLLGQLAAGAMLRHTRQMLHLHLALAALALCAAAVVAARTIGLYSHSPILARLAKVLLGLVVAQLVLGGLAMYVLGFVLERRPMALLQVISTCVHQTTAVLLLGAATLLAVWSRRLLGPPDT
jgi:cytochrome c oxidase assembly protein subunit 15